MKQPLRSAQRPMVSDSACGPVQRRSHPRRRQRPLNRAAACALEALERRVLLAATAFLPRVDYPVTGSADFVTLANLNGDSIPDMVVSSYGGSMLSVRLGTASGTFGAPSNIPLLAAPDYVGAADLNGDGKLDLIAAHFDNNTISVLLGHGNGTFVAAASFAAGTGPRAFTVGDFNGDGKLDLLMAKTFDKKLTLLRGNGNGTFQAPLNHAVSFTPTVVLAGDFNNDGKLDVAASDFYTDKVHLSLGNGDGTFQSAVAIGVGAGPSDLAIGDFNGDGKLDLATANFLGNNVSILRGNGNGTFLAAVNVAAGSGATSLVAVDLNQDGKLDLAIANANADSVTVLVGNSAGSFIGSGLLATGNSPRSISAALVNNDQIPDLVVTNQGAGSVSVLMGAPVDTIHPTATLSVTHVTAAGGTYHRFYVTYNDNVGINLSFLDNNDLQIAGPDGTIYTVRFLSVAAGAGNAQAARYQFNAPGGSFDWTDNGTYTVSMRTGQVRDTTGNSVRAGILGKFNVAIAPADGVGNTPETALDVGGMPVGRVRVVEDWVGTLDRNDYVKFTVSSVIGLNAKLTNLTDNADLMLFDAAGNRLVYSKNAGTTTEAFTRALSPGTYYLRVLFAGTVGTNYRLRLEALAPTAGSAPAPSNDNTLQTARDIGTLTGGLVRAYDGYIGSDDRNDFYKFTVTQPLRVYVKLTGLSDNADLMLLDSAGNRIAYSKRSGSADEYFQLDLTPGTYYARVLFAGTAPSSYRLRFEGM